MRAIPFHHSDFLSREDIHIYECSDRIVIPTSVFTSMGFVEGPVLLHISNAVGYVAGTLHNTHDRNNEVIYMPTWMVHRLKSTDNLSIASAPRHVCKTISLRPHNRDLLAIQGWHLKFAAAIRSYNTLTVDTPIPLVIDNKYMFMTICALNDNKYSTYYLVNGHEIDIEVLGPSDNPQAIQTDQTPYLYRDPRNTTHISNPYGGTGHVLGGTPSDRCIRELALEAAINRQKMT
jgi:hypothetical protein